MNQVCKKNESLPLKFKFVKLKCFFVLQICNLFLSLEPEEVYHHHEKKLDVFQIITIESVQEVNLCIQCPISHMVSMCHIIHHTFILHSMDFFPTLFNLLN
jgi:hypothetical protein